MKSYLLVIALCLQSCSDLGEHKPVEDWRTSTPEAQNLNPDSLTNLAARIEAGVYGEIHSLLVVRTGSLVFERYFRGYNSEMLHPVYSATKSVTSLLIGIAQDRGEIGLVTQRLLSFFPEYNIVANKQ
ncbi:MAG: serine hydrolase [Bacteroidota bacterium]